MSPVTPPPALALLRRQMREQRRALRPAEQRAAAQRLCASVSASQVFAKARRIAFYSAADGEIDPYPLLRHAWRAGKQVYLPVLHPFRSGDMIFVRWREGERLLPNRFGIPEPVTLRGSVAPWRLDLVLTPLVAFDTAGNRLGMGGGYYDRAFARRHQQRWPRRPVLCGLAHRFQQVDLLPASVWDVPLKRVFTG